MTAQNAGAGMVLASLNPHVRKILDDVNLTQFFVIADSEAAAIALLSRPAAASRAGKREGKQEAFGSATEA